MKDIVNLTLEMYMPPTFIVLFRSLQFLTNFRIPHPGRVGGRFFVDILMPSMLNWILGGNR